jgi:predicted MFS family arabinose efflux permease
MDARWLILAVLTAARTAMGFQYQTIGSTAPQLISTLGIGFTQIGTLIGLYHITGVVLSLPGGLIIQRFGDKRLCAVGLALMAGGGLMMTLAGDFAVLFCGRLVSGVGGILFNLVITKMTADWFARREIVLAMAIILATWPLGIALGLLAQPLIATAFGWRAVMLSAAVACLVSMTLVTLLYRAPAEQAPAGATSRLSLPPACTLVPVIVSGVIWGAFNAGLVGYFSFVPPLLAEAGGMTISAAGAITSLALWVGILSIPIGGYVAQRLQRPALTVFLFSGAAGVALIAITEGSPALYQPPLSPTLLPDSHVLKSTIRFT